MNIKSTLFVILVICTFNDAIVSDNSLRRGDKGFTKSKEAVKIISWTMKVASTFCNAVNSGKLKEGQLERQYNEMMKNMSEILAKINNVPQSKSRGFGTVKFNDELISSVSSKLSSAIEEINYQFTNFLKIRSFINYTTSNTYVLQDFADHAFIGESSTVTAFDELHSIFFGSSFFAPKSYLEHLADYFTVSLFFYDVTFCPIGCSN